MSIEHFLKNKELGLYDWGTVSIVYPTGRFIATDTGQSPDYYDPRFRFMIEVRTSKFLGSKKWVSLQNLKEIQRI